MNPLNLVMFTNTYIPHVGGVARSVQGLSASLRRLGHRVLVIAPRFGQTLPDEDNVIRIPAIQNIEGSDFSFPIPASRRLTAEIRKFQPDIVHSHHPFLLGDTALRIAATLGIPVIFTYHTRYEYYGHYTSFKSPRVQHFAMELALGYAELCDAIVAPSGSIADFLQSYGVQVPIQTIPSGIDIQAFSRGNRARGRQKFQLPENAFVVGHVGRLTLEKNLGFLVECLADFCLAQPNRYCLIAGKGELKNTIQSIFSNRGLTDRLRLNAVLDHSDLADCYSAMDVFAFSSHSETQGLVLEEAMASGTPVVALAASGVREIVEDKVNGRLLMAENKDDFVAALEWMTRLSFEAKAQISAAARLSARNYSQEKVTTDMEAFYRSTIHGFHRRFESNPDRWHAAGRGLAKEWKIVRNFTRAATRAVGNNGWPLSSSLH